MIGTPRITIARRYMRHLLGSLLSLLGFAVLVWGILGKSWLVAANQLCCELKTETEMEEIKLSFDDVVYFKEGVGPNGTQAYLPNTLTQLMKKWLETDMRNARFVIPFLSEGKECAVLRPGNAWVSGTVRVRLEFIPDEPEPEEVDEPESDEMEAQIESMPSLPSSPLDDLRSELNIK